MGTWVHMHKVGKTEKYKQNRNIKCTYKTPTRVNNSYNPSVTHGRRSYVLSWAVIGWLW